jgi:2-dehydro-3-deoxy-L-rhamnonate dehydrogenase (NAD+)
MEQSNLKNQVAVITGAASGLGFEIAKKLANMGVHLALMDISAPDVVLIRGNNSTKILFYKTDVADEKAVAKSIESVIADFGTVDILVNCAGITGKTNIKSHLVDSDDLRRVFDINFMGSYHTSKHVLPIMLAKNYGRILHIASIAGKEGNAGMLAYSASKAAVIGMAKVQGKEYAETGITVNALAPAVIKTALLNDMPEAQVTYMTDKIPMKRCGTLQEVANIVAYIVSPENSFTTGFTFDLSGGRATY